MKAFRERQKIDKKRNLKTELSETTKLWFDEVRAELGNISVAETIAFLLFFYREEMGRLEEQAKQQEIERLRKQARQQESPHDEG